MTNQEFLDSENIDEYETTRKNLLYGYLNDSDFKTRSKHYKKYKTASTAYGIKKAFIDKVYIINGKT